MGWRAMRSFSACTGSAAAAIRPRKDSVSTVPGRDVGRNDLGPFGHRGQGACLPGA